MIGNAYLMNVNAAAAGFSAAVLLQGQRIPGLVPAHEQQETISIDDHEILKADSDSDESPAKDSNRGGRSRGGGEFEDFTRNGFAPIQGDTSHYAAIKKCFTDGLGQRAAASGVAVTAIHRNSMSGPNAKARFISFRANEKGIAEKCGGGQAQARYAWYGASRDEIRQILSFGFSRCAGGHGFGVHLSAISFPTDCFDSATADEDGNKHLILCRVLLGKVEPISAGSTQSAPSSLEYDSGVDDLTNTRKYIVWSCFMNSHIFPAFIISFKEPATTNVNGLNRGPPVSTTRPRSPWMSFPALLRFLSGLLDPTIMTMVSKSYEDFRHHKISREQMIRVTRRLVGDELLTSVVRNHQKQELASRVIPRA